MSTTELSILFFLQIALILAIVKVVGWLVRFIGQPQVVGEMIAGVLLGPTLLGTVAPGVHDALFPAESISIIYAVSQLGLVLFMFLIGAEFDIDLLRARKRHAAMVSATGIIVPFTLGGLLALLLLDHPEMFGTAVRPFEAFLFVGSAMSITAFPMLARMIHEHGLSKTPMGTLALAAGSIDDAAAWCFLAVVLASFGGDAMVALSAIGGGLAYALFVFFVVRPLLRRFLEPVVLVQGRLSGPVLTTILMLVMAGAWFTDLVGIYAVFGAFILGTAMPRGLVVEELHRKIHPLAANFLLPLFFIFSGLQTQFGLLAEPVHFLYALLILSVATIGKGVACYAAARWSGEDNKSALLIGTFMNARGMMELILLNIGLERGIVTPTMFAMLVLMTVITTMMVGPILEAILRRSPEYNVYRAVQPMVLSED